MFQLPFGDHMHDLDATQNDTRAAEVLKPEHAPRALPSGRRSDDAFDGPMVLLNHVVQIFDLTDLELVKDLPGQRNTSRRCDHGAAEQPSVKEEVMDTITRVGVDLAKNVIQIHAVDAAERVVARRAIARNRFLSWFANLKPCLIAMEACSAAHYWARKLRALGHEVRLIPPHFVVPYRGVHVKNDP